MSPASALARSGLLAVAVLLAAACAPSTPAAGPAGPTPTAPLPMASLTPQMTTAAAAIQRGLGASGFRLEHVVQPFRPGEPGSLRFVPRALFRVLLSDPDSGWVLLYDLGQPERAAQAARDLVAYLQSGFGQTNYPQDAQFTVNQLDSTLMFSWWSRQRSADPEEAEAAFNALRLIGQPFPVVR